MHAVADVRLLRGGGGGEPADQLAGYALRLLPHAVGRDRAGGGPDRRALLRQDPVDGQEHVRLDPGRGDGRAGQRRLPHGALLHHRAGGHRALQRAAGDPERGGGDRGGGGRAAGNLLGLCMFHASGAGGGGGDGGPGAAHGHSHTHVGGSDSRHWLRRKKRSDAEKLAGNGSSVRDQEEINILVNSGSPINCVNADKQDVFSTRRSGDSRLVNDLLRENNMQSLQMNGISILDDHLDEYGDVEDTASQLNMRGVFLHVLGDALGSVIVVVNALIFYFVWNPCPESGPCINLCRHDHCPDRHLNGTQSNMSEYREIIPEAGPCWVLFLDPTLCCIMVCILLYTTYPLLKESALILLQTVPKQIDVQLINEKLRNLEGVLAVHELHVWQLAGSRIIATAHIKCRDPTAYMDVAKRIKDFFHDEGIHATTIQPEFASVNSESRISVCELPCKTQCALKQCCGNGEKSSSDSKLETPSTHSLEVIGESSSECPNVRTERNEMGNNAVKIKDTQYESAV